MLGAWGTVRLLLLCLGPGSNRRPFPLQGNALPTELPKQLGNYIKLLLLRKLTLELVDESLDVAELRLRLGTGALDLLIGV